MHIKSPIIKSFSVPLTPHLATPLGEVRHLQISSPRPMLCQFPGFPFNNAPDSINLGAILHGPYGQFQVQNFSDGNLGLERIGESWKIRAGSAGATFGAGMAFILPKLGAVEGLSAPVTEVLEEAVRPAEYEIFIARKQRVIQSIDDTSRRIRGQIKELKIMIESGKFPPGKSAKLVAEEIQQLEDYLGVMDIFPLIVTDPVFDDLIREDILGKGCPIAAAVANYKNGRIFQMVMASMPSVEDSKTEFDAIFTQLSTEGRDELFKHLITDYPGPVALLVEDLSISESMTLPPNIIRAVLTREGGPTSHLFISPKAQGIHCLYGLHGNYVRFREGDVIAIDGLNREIMVNPEEATLLHIREMAHGFNSLHGRALKKFHFKNPCTRGATRPEKVQVIIRGNAAARKEYNEMLKFGLKEAGLGRTELEDLCDDMGNLLEAPKTEDELFDYNRRIMEGTVLSSMIKRTTDTRPEKPLPGYRPISLSEIGVTLEGVGLSLAYLFPPANLSPAVSREIFKPFHDHFHKQLRALLRVSGLFRGRVKLEFPYVQNYAEWRHAYEFLGEVKKELKAEKKDFDPKLEVGVMVEVPWLVGEELRRIMMEADFASFGGNDMLRTFFRIDRDVPMEDVLRKAYAPQFLSLLASSVKIVGEAAAERKKRIPYQGCGEMSSDLLLLPPQIGVGMFEFSVSPPKGPIIKHLVSQLYLRDLTDTLIPRIMSASNCVTARRQAVETYRELQARKHFPRGRFFDALIKSAES